MLRLDDLIGKTVLLALQNSERGSYEVVLHGVEAGGLWIEGGEIGELIAFLAPKPRKGQPRQKPVVFFPYAQIAFLQALSTEI